MYAHPGKKLLFMGSELAPSDEWNHDQSLDWRLLDFPQNAGIQLLIRDLNRLYSGVSALHEIDFSADGFEWIRWDDNDNSILSWIRRDSSGGFVICISNFTPIVRQGYRIGVPELGRYQELLNTDDAKYGGSGIGNPNIQCESISFDDRTQSIYLSLPPLATLILARTN
jgi:1,4-alpha-glucan branching enzyme